MQSSLNYKYKFQDLSFSRSYSVIQKQSSARGNKIKEQNTVLYTSWFVHQKEQIKYVTILINVTFITVGERVE